MKRVVVSSVVTLLIITLVGIGFYYYNKSSLFKSSPLAAIPPDAPFIFRSNTAGKTLEQIFRNDAWRKFQLSSPGNSIVFVDSLFRKDPQFRTAWQNQELYVSMHVTKASSYDFLFLMNTTPEFTDGVIDRLLERMTGSVSQKRRYENVTIREASSSRGPFVYAVIKGVFIGSFTSFLVEDAIRQMKTGTPVDENEAFKAAGLYQHGGELTCFVNYSGLSNLASNFGSVNAEVISKYLATAAAWSVMDANLQSHSLLMSGFTATADTSQLTALFTGQFPVENKLSEVVPGRTAFLLNYGFSNAKGFFESAGSYASFFDDKEERRAALARLNRKYGIDVESKMTSWIGSNLSLAVTEAGNVNFTNNSFLCVEARNAEDAKRKLDALRIQVNKMSGIPDKQETYRNHTISLLNLPDIAPLLYGKLFSRLGKFYYTTIRNFVVAGNTASALRSFIDDYEDKKTLAQSPYGKQALQSISNSHNFFLYMRLPGLQNISKAYFPSSSASADGDGMANQPFTTVTMSISNQSAGLLTSVLWNSLTDDSKGIRLIASAKLDTAVTMRPCVFSVPGEDPKRIAIQDAGNRLYLLDETGEVLWKREMSERILGDIHTVDYFKNGDVQILFNTATALHLVSLSGEYIGNYPIRFPSSATTGLVVVKSESDGESRLFVYCRNGQVYAYELSGKPYGNWSYNASFNGVENPILPVTFKGKKYLLLYTPAGELRSLDVSGNEINLWPPRPFTQITGTLKVIPGDSLHEPVVAGLDSAHRIILLSGDGKITTQETSLAGPVFDFTLLAEPGGKRRAAFLTGDSLVVYDENKNRVFGIQLNSLPGAVFQPSAYSASRFQCPLLNGAGKIYLVDPEGKTAEGFPVKGSSLIGSYYNTINRIYTWVAGDTDGTIYVYEMK